MSFDLSDYVQVNERIQKFYEKYPKGSLQAEIIELSDKRVTVRAYAYREPDDTRPGIGSSFMNIPGPTQFSKGSELENAETSAWGRALAALGFEVKRGLASAEEVANKQETPAKPHPRRQPHPTPARAETPPPEDPIAIDPNSVDDPWEAFS